MANSRQRTRASYIEGKTLEFKRDLSSPGPVLRTLVAFANSAGGRLVIDRTELIDRADRGMHPCRACQRVPRSIDLQRSHSGD